MNVDPAFVEPENRAVAAAVRMLVLDVDGVCTDGKLYMHNDGTALKCFHAHDGIGIKLALKSGIDIAVITGRIDPGAEARMKGLGVTHYFAGHFSKISSLTAISEATGISFKEMAYLGDDLIDLDPMEAVGMPVAVANARPEVKAAARHTTTLCGGEGAVRETVEWLLRARGVTDMAAAWRSDAKQQ